MQTADCKITIKSSVVNPANWQHADQESPIPLQQHPVYGLAIQAFGATASQVSFYTDEGVSVGSALLIHRKFFGVIRLTTIFRGPLWHAHNIPKTTKLACYLALKNSYTPWRWNFLISMPEDSEAPLTLNAFNKAGMKRVMTGFSTAWLDLRPNAETLRSNLKGKWRNQLVKAEKSGISISMGGRKPHQYNWLLAKEESQRSTRRYQATPLGLVPAFIAASTPKSGCGVLSVTAIKGRKKIAGALFLLHGNSATYHIGWAGDEARNINAQNQVLWEGMLALKEKGICFLDLGGLNTQDLAGIARFKLGTGAEPHTLAGAFL